MYQQTAVFIVRRHHLTHSRYRQDKNVGCSIPRRIQNKSKPLCSLGYSSCMNSPHVGMLIYCIDNESAREVKEAQDLLSSRQVLTCHLELPSHIHWVQGDVSVDLLTSSIRKPENSLV